MYWKEIQRISVTDECGSEKNLECMGQLVSCLRKSTVDVIDH